MQKFSSKLTTVPPPPVSAAPLSQMPPPAQPAVATLDPPRQPLITEPMSAPESGPEWIVNVMTVTDPKVAKEHVARLTAEGYPATMRTEQVRGRSSYRVIIPGLTNDEAANRVVSLLKQRMGYAGAWALQKR